MGGDEAGDRQPNPGRGCAMTGNAWMQDILALELDSRTKGIPLATGRVRLGDVGKQAGTSSAAT